MSRVNPKEHYLHPVTKAASYLITRFEAGSTFVASALGVVFSLPDSNADADVVNCDLEVGCGNFPTSVKASGTDEIWFKGALITAISLPNGGDTVRLVCPVAGRWSVLAFEGSPVFEGVPTPDRWTQFDATWQSSSTFTIPADPALIGKLRPGVPILQTSQTDMTKRNYAIVKSVGLSGTSPLVTVTGQALTAGNRWFFGSADFTEQRTYTIPGNFNDADDPTLLQSDLSAFFRWDEDDAHLVNVETRCITDDTGNGKPTINISIGGTDALSAGVVTSSSWNDAAMTVQQGSDESAGKLVFNDLIEIAVVNQAFANKDAQDLTVVLTVVKDKNPRSDFDPCPGTDPVLNMVISGLVGPDTWCGLGDGIHAICPSSYTLTPMPTTGTAFVAAEAWQFKTATTGSYFDQMRFGAKKKIPTVSGTTTSASSQALLVMMTGTGSAYTFAQKQYAFPGHPSPWPGRVRDRLMGSAVLDGVTFTWAKMGNRWYKG